MTVLVVMMIVGAVGTLFSKAGGRISERPYVNQYGGAPGAAGPERVNGHDDRGSMRDWSRGAR